MRTLIIDRFEGTYAICEDKDQKFFALEIAELPQGAEESSVIEIDGDGVVTLDQEKTAAYRAKIKSKQDKLWE